MAELAGRVRGIDAARGIAIIGMFALHCIPARSEALGVVLVLFGDQRAQILFAVLDGVVLGILSVAGRANSAERKADRRSIAVRAVCLVATGLFLETFTSGIIGILDYYGVFLLLALPLLYVRIRYVVGLSALLLVVGPFIAHSAQMRWVIGPAVTGQSGLMPVLSKIADWLVVGQYPAVVWMAYVGIGLAIWRLGYGRLFKIRMFLPLVAAAMLFLLAGSIAQDSIFAETLTLVGSSAIAVCVLQICLLAASSRLLRPGGIGSWPGIVIQAIGRMPITIYCLHVISFGILAASIPLAQLQSDTLFVVTLIASAVLAVAWSVTTGRGPMEKLFHELVGPRVGAEQKKNAN